MTDVLKMLEAGEDWELFSGAADLRDCMSRIAEDRPSMVAVAWVAHGESGALCAVRAAKPGQIVILPTAIEDVKSLAEAVDNLPPDLRESFADFLAIFQANRQNIERLTKAAEVAAAAAVKAG